MQEQDSFDSLDIGNIPYRPEFRYEWFADLLANVSKEQPSHNAEATKTNETKTSQSKFYDQNESVQGTVDQNEDTSTESSKPGSAISSISSATLLARFTLQLGEEQPPANSKSNLITHNGKMLIAALCRADLQAQLPRQKNHRRWVLSMLTKLKKKVDSRSKIMNELLYEDNSDLPQQRKQKKWNRDYYAKYLTENYKNDVLQNRHIEDKKDTNLEDELHELEANMISNEHKPLPPSYQTKLVERQSRISHNPNYQERQRKLLALNESEIEAEHRRREAMKQSYQRQIQRLTVVLQKNLERKDRLKSELEILELDGSELQRKLGDFPTPQLPKFNDALQKKQEEVLSMKNHLINEMREKEQEMGREVEQQLNDWQLKLKDKEKVLAGAEQRRNFAKTQLIKGRREQPQRLVLGKVEQDVRQRKHQEFLYDYNALKEKIVRIGMDRQAAIRETTTMNSLKDGVIRDQLHRIEQIRRQLLQLQVSVVELESRNKQIDRANENLRQQQERKEKLITHYENDIKDLRLLISDKDGQFAAQIQRFRGRPNQTLGSEDLELQLQQMDKLVREVQSDNFRLRTDFKRLTDLLSSMVSKSIYQTFNDMRFS